MQTWQQVVKKRCFLTLIWITGAVIVAGIPGAGNIAGAVMYLALFIMFSI